MRGPGRAPHPSLRSAVRAAGRDRPKGSPAGRKKREIRPKVRKRSGGGERVERRSQCRPALLGGENKVAPHRKTDNVPAVVVLSGHCVHDGNIIVQHYMDRQIGERERSERITRNSSPKIRALIKAAFDSTPDRSNISSSRMYSSSVKLTEQRRTAGSDLGGRPPRPRLCGFSVSAITANFIPCGRVKIPIRRHAPSS